MFESKRASRGRDRGGNDTKKEARVQIWPRPIRRRSTSGTSCSTSSILSTEKLKLKQNLLPGSKTMGALMVSSRGGDEPVPSAWHKRHSGYSERTQTRRPKITAPPPLPASHRTKRLQHVESMCAPRAKISDRVAEVQRAINGPHCAACEWKFQKSDVYTVHAFTQHEELLAAIMLLTPGGSQGQGSFNTIQSGESNNTGNPFPYYYNSQGLDVVKSISINQTRSLVLAENASAFGPTCYQSACLQARRSEQVIPFPFQPASGFRGSINMPINI